MCRILTNGWKVGSMQTIKELTKAGCGITFLYEAAVRRELEEGSPAADSAPGFSLLRMNLHFIWRRGSIYADWYRELLPSVFLSNFRGSGRCNSDLCRYMELQVSNEKEVTD